MLAPAQLFVHILLITSTKVALYSKESRNIASANMMLKPFSSYGSTLLETNALNDPKMTLTTSKPTAPAIQCHSCRGFERSAL